MEVVNRIDDLRRIITEAKLNGETVGLVPTMGALHEGHMTLVKQSVVDRNYTVVSIFVNPTQFGPNEDYSKYPRAFESDAEMCREAGVDLIFAPTPEEMYPKGFNTYIDVDGVTDMLEGAARPGHFRGVATVVTKLFAAVEPRRAYFGMKDYQQLKVIQKMVHDLNIKVDVVPVPTVREADGLAMSSRNAYLSTEERKAAAVLYRSLVVAKEKVESGEKDAEAVRLASEEMIKSEPLANVDYVAAVHPETLEPATTVQGGVLIVLAVRFGKTRLIDNILIG